MKRESSIENYMISKVRAAGGECLKWVSPGTNGVPDRIVFLPGGVIKLVELKAEGERPRKIQKAVHRRLEKLGVRVAVIDSKECVDAFMSLWGDAS